LRAFVVAESGATPDGDEIKLYVKENLARHKVPCDVVFIDELPRNATGKLLRRCSSRWTSTTRERDLLCAGCDVVRVDVTVAAEQIE
jgi:acyl-CoA synthetase (AMP-forming)/AMP-acid ligase II